jgi:hypothetical protein
MTEYAFDVKMFAAIRIDAESEEDARKVLNEVLDYIDVSYENAEHGNQVAGVSLSTDDEDPYLFEIDGDPV